MGNEAENREIDPSEENELDTEELETEGLSDEETGESESTEEEVEVYLEGEDAAPEETEQDKINKAVQSRLGREQKKTKAANDEAEAAKQRAEMLEEEKKILELKLQQKAEKEAEINPDDYELGEDDPKYLRARLKRLEEKKSEPSPAPVTEPEAPDMTPVLTKHYENVVKANLKDYSDVEDKVIDEIGQDAFNYICQKYPEKSHLINYALGNNEAKLSKLAEHVKSRRNDDALLLLGDIAARVNTRKVSKSNTPDPVEEEKGGVSSGQRGPKGATFE